SGYWALLAVPSRDGGSGAPSGNATGSGAGEPSGEALADPSADTVGIPAAEPAPDPSADAAIASARDRPRAGDLAGARTTARTLVGAVGRPAVTARRILAAAWFLEGERGRALTEWNALGEPVIDLVLIGGLEATRHYSAAARISLDHGDVLEPVALALA